MEKDESVSCCLPAALSRFPHPSCLPSSCSLFSLSAVACCLPLYFRLPCFSTSAPPRHCSPRMSRITQPLLLEMASTAASARSQPLCRASATALLLSSLLFALLSPASAQPASVVSSASPSARLTGGAIFIIALGAALLLCCFLCARLRSSLGGLTQPAAPPPSLPLMPMPAFHSEGERQQPVMPAQAAAPPPPYSSATAEEQTAATAPTAAQSGFWSSAAPLPAHSAYTQPLYGQPYYGPVYGAGGGAAGGAGGGYGLGSVAGAGIGGLLLGELMSGGLGGGNICDGGEAQAGGEGEEEAAAAQSVGQQYSPSSLSICKQSRPSSGQRWTASCWHCASAL